MIISSPDYFVHRLFQNKEDGKLVEHKSADDGLEERESKIEAIQLEVCFWFDVNCTVECRNLQIFLGYRNYPHGIGWL